MRDGFWKSLLGLVLLVLISAAAICVKLIMMKEREINAGRKTGSYSSSAPCRVSSDAALERCFRVTIVHNS